MRRIFLTSGLLLCLACPAFADIAAGTSSANCDESVLGSDTGPVDFISQWRPMISGAITLNSGQGANPTAAPATLYAVYGVGVYNSQPTVQTLANFTTSNRLTSLSTNPQKTGYHMLGVWTTETTGGTQVIDSSGNFIYDAASTQFSTETTPINWYVRWEPDTFNITYSCGTAPSGASETVDVNSVPPANGSATYTQAYTLSSSYGSCALLGYHATGWDCTGGATLTNATGNQNANTWSSASAIACTVHWTPNEIGLNYYQDENAVTPFTTDTCTYDDTFTLPTNYQPKNGYHFNGWVVRQ